MHRRVVLYYIHRRPDRWLRGDEKFRKHIRRWVRGPEIPSGIDIVFQNLCAGLRQAGVNYVVNLPFSEIRSSDMVGVIGRGKHILSGYNKDNPIVAGVAIVEHPLQWPTLFDDYPIARYVVPAPWVKDIFVKHYGERVDVWPVGIDTSEWSPTPEIEKSIDFLIYDKIHWSHASIDGTLVKRIRDSLYKRNLSSEVIRYGEYRPSALKSSISRCKGMIFLSEHESQGLACQQVLSCDVPVLAWDPGHWLDPARFGYGESLVTATSVPYFDDRCGLTFRDAVDFEEKLDIFLSAGDSNNFAPRSYILENLQLSDCALRYCRILERVS